jgi:hypothetical protein
MHLRWRNGHWCQWPETVPCYVQEAGKNELRDALLTPPTRGWEQWAYSCEKTPLIHLDGTGSLLSEVLGDMMHPCRSVSICDDFLNEAQVIHRDGLRAWSVVGVFVWLGQTLGAERSVLGGHIFSKISLPSSPGVQVSLSSASPRLLRLAARSNWSCWNGDYGASSEITTNQTL